jgi:hypothetical protein
MDPKDSGRRDSFVRHESEISWAAGMWVLAYNAKKESRGAGRGYVEHVKRESQERMRRAGV